MRDGLSESLYALLFDLNRQWSPPMNILQVFRNEFLHKLGTDHIAVDRNGVPIARAADRASIEKAAPDAAAYFSGPDFAVANNTPPAGAVLTTGVAVVQPTEIPVEAPEPIVSETTPADATTDLPVPALDDSTRAEITDDTVLPDGPATEQPSQDNDHIEPGAEEFPEPAVAADDPAQN